MAYTCDICSKPFNSDDKERWHCLDCYDFDECGGCSGMHNSSEPLHRVRIVTQEPNSHKEHPLVSQLLKPSTGNMLKQEDYENVLDWKEHLHRIAWVRCLWALLEFGQIIVDSIRTVSPHASKRVPAADLTKEDIANFNRILVMVPTFRLSCLGMDKLLIIATKILNQPLLQGASL